MQEIEVTLRHSHDWVLERIGVLCLQKNYEDARSLEREFSEWLNPSIENHDIYSLVYLGDE